MRRLACALTLVALGTTACTSSGGTTDATPTFRPVAAPAVGLDAAGSLPGPLRIGLLVSSVSPRGEGAEHTGPAAGARVAESRLDGPDDRVALEVVDDHGTAQGALDAVAQLLASGVAGIVCASSGPHLDAALQAASQAGTAVLLPYDRRAPQPDQPAVWRTGPTGPQVAAGLRALLASRSQSAPYVLAGEGVGDELAGLGEPGDRAAVVAGDGVPAVAAAAVQAVAEGRADSLVVDASAETTAEVVAAVQAVDGGVPVVVGPDALAPAFPARLQELGAQGGATTAGQFATVGTAATDTSGSPGVVAFLAALRLAAQDPAVPALLGSGTFAEDGAAGADAAAHDAVVALAHAARTAGSVEPGDVLAALRSSRLGEADGLAGPPLDLTRPDALADDTVVALQATTRGPAARGTVTAAPALTWFALPSSAR